MMSRSSEILFMAEYIKNVLYFATVRPGKSLKSTTETHYFCTDSELIYENYYSDFGPLNLGCIFKYCKNLNEKLNLYLNKQTIVHYTATDPKKKANAAFLLGCYGVLYLSLIPRDALKPLLVHGQSYRPFQDATQGDSAYTISIMDCLLAIKKARDLGLFNFHDFNLKEYERLDKIQGGDLNWIVPGKFLAFIGPVDYNVSLYHPPEMYIDYFLDNKVEIVIRLNKRLYDGNVFNNAGIVHYDLYFPDGSTPPRHILQKFLQISEESVGAIAVHCKAGLGRTGSLIGCYLIKHYRMTAREAIGWMRICRPGSVIGHQQGWLEQLEAWLMKQGNLYRKRNFNDTEKMPKHDFGVYSIAETAKRQRPLTLHRSPSPPPPAMRVIRTDVAVSIGRPQSSKSRDDKNDDVEVEEKVEVYLTSCDLTVPPDQPMTQMKGCIIRNSTITEENDDIVHSRKIPLWKNILLCKSCIKTFQDAVWALSVRCARIAPGTCYYNRICRLLDMVAATKTEKEQLEWRVKPSKMTLQKFPLRGDPIDPSSPLRRRGCSGEPRPPRTFTRSPVPRNLQPNVKPRMSEESNSKTSRLGAVGPTVTTFRSSNGPVIKNLSEARNFLIRSSIRTEEREKQLNSSLIVTPHYSTGTNNYCNTPKSSIGNVSHISHFSSSINTVPRTPQPQMQRRRLGRSPSPAPPQARQSKEQTRATNTTTNTLPKNVIPAPAASPRGSTKESRATLRDALSRLKLTVPRDGSVGAASLGARRDAPSPKLAPSVRSDERPIATQGDMLNSIKFQRRYRDSLRSKELSSSDKISSVFSVHRASRERGSINTITSISGPHKITISPEYEPYPRDKANLLSTRTSRPASPKGRSRTSYYSP